MGQRAPQTAAFRLSGHPRLAGAERAPGPIYRNSFAAMYPMVQAIVCAQPTFPTRVEWTCISRRAPPAQISASRAAKPKPHHRPGAAQQHDGESLEPALSESAQADESNGAFRPGKIRRRNHPGFSPCALRENFLPHRRSSPTNRHYHRLCHPERSAPGPRSASRNGVSGEKDLRLLLCFGHHQVPESR